MDRLRTRTRATDLPASRRLAAALLFAGVSVVVGCRLADTDGITPVPQFLAFLPWLLVPTGLGLLCTLLTRVAVLVLRQFLVSVDG